MTFQCWGWRFDPSSRSQDPTFLVAPKPKAIKQKQYCSKFDKDFQGKMIHVKKKFFFNNIDLAPIMSQMNRTGKFISDSSVEKDLPTSAGDVGSIPGSGRCPGEGNGNPLQNSCLGNPMDGRSLAGYNPCGHKSHYTTWQLNHYHA